MDRPSRIAVKALTAEVTVWTGRGYTAHIIPVG